MGRKCCCRIVDQHNNIIYPYEEIVDDLTQDQLGYYVNMPRLSIINNHEFATTFSTLIVDLAHVSLDVETIVKNLKHSNQEALARRSLLSLPQLFARTHGWESLVDYSQSHVLTL